MDTSTKTEASLRNQGVGIIVMLVLQYILGMTANLFVQFPDSGNEGQMWQFAWSHFFVAVHIILGLLLFIAAVVLLVRAIRSKNQIWKTASSWGIIFIVIAAFSGSQFISTQNDAYSLFMSLAFIAALLSYCWGLYSHGKSSLKKV